VIHSTKREKFDDIQNGIFKMDRRSRICFETDAIEESYMKLLEHRCPECPQGHEEEDGGDGGRHAQSVLFRNFKQLDTHIRREHELFYCELCVVHLMVRSKASKKKVRLFKCVCISVLYTRTPPVQPQRACDAQAQG
jgi:hypothetical protein